tara:strand:+ start:9419 stop:9652 length:234 start_codon:yes stop_codon:yes gene_type:complete
MIMYNVDDVLKARRLSFLATGDEHKFFTESIGGTTREVELINALLDIRDSSDSGSYEMSVVDQTLGKMGYTPWRDRC